MGCRLARFGQTATELPGHSDDVAVGKGSMPQVAV